MAGGKWEDVILRDGVAVIQSVFSREEIGRLDRAIQERSLPRSRAGIRHALRHPAVRHVAGDPRLQKIAGTILDGDAIPFRATLFNKSASSSWLVVWHQDTTLPVRAKVECEGWGPWSVKDGVQYAHAPASALEQVIALRVHLDASTEKNGPLRVLPWTHTLGVLSDEEVEKTAQGASTPISLTADVGDVIAMRPLVIHSSQKSSDHAPRRVLHIEYASRVNFAEMRLAITD